MDSINYVEDIRRKLETNSGSSKCLLNQMELNFLKETVNTSYKVWLLIKNYPQLRDEYNFLELLENTIDSYHNGDSKLAYMCEYCDSEIVLLNNDPGYSYEMHRQSEEHIELVTNFALLNPCRVAVKEILKDRSIQDESSDYIEDTTSSPPCGATGSRIVQQKISISQIGTSSISSNASNVINDLTKDAVGRPLYTVYSPEPLSTWYFSEFETSPDNATDFSEVTRFFLLTTSRICSLCSVAVPLKGDDVHLRGRRHRGLMIRKLAEANKWFEVKNSCDMNYFTTPEHGKDTWRLIQLWRKYNESRIFVQFFLSWNKKH